MDWPSCIVLAKIHHAQHSGIVAGAHKQLAAVVVVDNEDCSEDLSDESASCCARQAFLLQTNINVTGRCLQVASIQAVFSVMSVTGIIYTVSHKKRSQLSFVCNFVK